MVTGLFSYSFMHLIESVLRSEMNECGFAHIPMIILASFDNIIINNTQQEKDYYVNYCDIWQIKLSQDIEILAKLSLNFTFNFG